MSDGCGESTVRSTLAGDAAGGFDPIAEARVFRAYGLLDDALRTLDEAARRGDSAAAAEAAGIRAGSDRGRADGIEDLSAVLDLVRGLSLNSQVQIALLARHLAMLERNASAQSGGAGEPPDNRR